ncbi:hypothetical protein PLIP_b0549 [Pseudoalteromonas lipolytica LMEB 39]|nr:hypothetical protein [Pseudoalteromonas lipolytica LMEB 39]
MESVLQNAKNFSQNAANLLCNSLNLAYAQSSFTCELKA